MKTAAIFIFVCFMVSPMYANTDVENLIHSTKQDTFETGQKVYKQYCMACHAASNIMVSSPKFGDKKDWGNRLLANRSLNELVKSAIKGKNAMPKKGRCVKCGENDIRSAILYMMRGEP